MKLPNCPTAFSYFAAAVCTASLVHGFYLHGLTLWTFILAALVYFNLRQALPERYRSWFRKLLS